MASVSAVYQWRSQSCDDGHLTCLMPVLGTDITESSWLVTASTAVIKFVGFLECPHHSYMGQVQHIRRKCPCDKKTHRMLMHTDGYFTCTKSVMIPSETTAPNWSPTLQQLLPLVQIY